jgi:hypothetical protein
MRMRGEDGGGGKGAEGDGGARDDSAQHRCNEKKKNTTTKHSSCQFRKQKRKMSDSSSSNSNNNSNNELVSQKELFVRRAIAAGISGGAVGVALAAAATAAVLRRPWYVRLNVSAKTAPFAIGALGGFGLGGERRLVLDRQALDAAALQRAAAATTSTEVVPQLDTVRLESLVAWPRENPFKFVIGTGVPLVGAILWRNLRSGVADSAGGKVSVALMHTRVVGQFSVLCLLVAAMLLSGRGPGAWSELQEQQFKQNEAAARAGRLQAATKYVDQKATVQKSN